MEQKETDKSKEEKPFVDREEYIQAFKAALESIKEKRSVLIYHGVPGIGKTSLRKNYLK
jgi:tRNA A37 threonylcarbamoyladenosine biosynthesis protein TsaE